MAVNIVLARIDDRLIHGQVAIGWVKAVQPQQLIVANDAAADDPMQRTLMEMAAPPQVGLSLCQVKELPALLSQEALQGKRLLVLFATVRDALNAIENGLKIKELNIGGMRFSSGKKQIMKAVAIDDLDREYFRKIIAHGVHASIQMVSTDEPVGIEKFL
jgi:mannose/fructose/sorbose-specific phosphotransferase system IIB component